MTGKSAPTEKRCWRQQQRLAVGVVEVGGALARKLEVLALVLADGDMCCAVDEHVGGHEHGVREETQFEAGASLVVGKGRVVLEMEFALGEISWGERDVIERPTGDLTFHWVIRERYPTDAVQLSSHISSECAGTADW